MTYILHFRRELNVKRIFYFLFIIIIVSCSSSKSKVAIYHWPEDVKPPTVEQISTSLEMHGDKRRDEFYWLNQRENPKVLEYLQAENAYLDTMLSGTKMLQKKLFEEMKGRIKEKDETVPYKDNGFWYYSRYEEGKQYRIFCRKKELNAVEEVLLDHNELAKGYQYHDVGARAVSDNNQLLAYTVDTVSRRLYNLHFKDLSTGNTFDEVIPNVERNSLAWASDNKTVFYIKKNITTLLGFQVWRHELGSDPEKDVLVYEEKDNRYYLHVYRTKSKKYIAVHSTLPELSSEIRFLTAAQPSGHLWVFHKREPQLQYDVEHYHDKFYIRTDWNAPNFRVMQTPENRTSRDNWKELIPHHPEKYVSEIAVFANHLAIAEVKQALNQMRIIRLSDNQDHYVTFDEDVYSAYIDVNPEFDTNTLRLSYTSLTTPPSILDYNMDTRDKELKKQTEVLGGFDKNDYRSERIWAEARDGKKIPLSLVYKKGIAKNGTNPLLLYAYGSYGYSMFPSFNTNVISLLNRGFIYAIAHVRGGQEMGRSWYDEGRMLKKMNTFYDFIDCAEHLIKEGYTTPDHLYANGGSAGGLLMGAIANLRPDLWNGIIAEVPFVDVIGTMSDPNIPLTTNEYEEWGNPADSAEYFYIKSYSPYDNVERKDYPHMLVTTGLHDSQVQYFEPAKWVARLRSMKTDKNLLLFHINMDFGHGGASGRFDYLKDKALQYAFLLALEGKTE